MSEKLHIRGGDVVRPDGIQHRHDILIEDGRIVQIDSLIPVPDDTPSVNAQGFLVMPGAIDMHVHFREPSSNNAEDLESGAKAAAAGGVTAFAEMPNTQPLTTMGAPLEDKIRRAKGRCDVDYSFYVTFDPERRREDVRDHLDVRSDQVPGIKAFLGGTTKAHAISDEDFGAICTAAQKHGVPVTVHAEEDAILAETVDWLRHVQGVEGVDVPEDAPPDFHARARDALACVASTCRALRASRRYNIHLHIAHVTTAAEVELIRAAKRQGDRVTAEVTLHHLWFAADAPACATADLPAYEHFGHFLKCNPSVKYERDREALWEGLRDGTIDMIGTDHAPHPRPTKEDLPWSMAPSGCASAVEFLLPAMLTAAQAQGFTPVDVARWTATNPASIFGIRDRGDLRVGMPANLAICVHPHHPQQPPHPIVSKCGHSLWRDIPLGGLVMATFLRGVPVHVRNGWQELEARHGLGEPVAYSMPRSTPGLS